MAEFDKASDWLSSKGQKRKDHAAFMRLWLGKCFEQNGNGHQTIIPMNRVDRQSALAKELHDKYKQEEENDGKIRDDQAIDVSFEHLA